MTKKPLFIWILRILCALILLQTLFFKFTGASESVFIFSSLGIEPWGRIATGVLELIASILILVPATTGIGALLAVGLMSGAIMAHFTKLGIEIQGDGGQLFIYALVAWLTAAILAYIYRTQYLTFLKTVKQTS